MTGRRPDGRLFPTQVLSRRLEQERASLQRMDEQRRQFLHLAVAHLVRCLWIREQKSVQHMFQLCSYWLENTGDERVTELVSNGWASIASANFLPLFYQLAARYGRLRRPCGVFFAKVLLAWSLCLSLNANFTSLKRGFPPCHFTFGPSLFSSVPFFFSLPFQALSRPA